MADLRRVRLTHEERFPAGAFAVAVEAVQEFDAERGRTGVQAREKDSGLPLWVVNVFDPDPEARNREVRVRIAATDEPVLPPMVAVPGVLEGLRPVVFRNLLGTPYVNTQGRKAVLAWSYRAEGMTAPTLGGQPAAAADSAASAAGETGRRNAAGGGSR